MRTTSIAWVVLIGLAFINTRLVGNAWAADADPPGTPLELGSRLELFVDSYLVDRTEGDLRRKMHRPEPREVVLVTGEPWEGNTCAYYTIFRDGDRFRMYYRGSHYDEKTKRAAHREFACYAESRDGVHWEKPKLGLFEFNGSKQNNIVWDGPGTHNFTVFKDENPACPAASKYKAFGVVREKGRRGLLAFHSPDGVRWSLMQQQPVVTKGAFDSQNLAFWDPHLGKYREFHRGFRNGVRDILTGTSSDFLKWTAPKYLEYGKAPREHLYTNAIRVYPRAPHILLGFPTRYQPKNSQVEPILMSSRDGFRFERWNEPLIPITAPKDRDGNRSNYMTWGLVQLPGKDREYSVYASEAYYTGPDSRLRRFAFRVDGFVSLNAGQQGGAATTKPLRFAGDKLMLNVRTREQGRVRVEVRDAGGEPLPGYALADCRPINGDFIATPVRWKAGGDLKALAGKSVRLHFEVRDADVYSLQFQP